MRIDVIYPLYSKSDERKWIRIRFHPVAIIRANCGIITSDLSLFHSPIIELQLGKKKSGCTKLSAIYSRKGEITTHQTFIKHFPN